MTEEKVKSSIMDQKRLKYLLMEMFTTTDFEVSVMLSIRSKR